MSLEFGIGAVTRSLLQWGNRLARSFLPHQQGAQKLQCLQVLRILRKDFPGKAFGLAQVAMVAGRHRLRQGFSLGSYRGACAFGITGLRFDRQLKSPSLSRTCFLYLKVENNVNRLRRQIAYVRCPRLKMLLHALPH